MPNLQLLLHKVLDAVVVMRRDGTIAEWNGCAEATFGRSREEVLGRDMNELIVPPHYRDAHKQGLQRYLETGEGPVLDRRIEISAIDASGREFPVELSITETVYEGEQVFIGFLRDISDRKAAELALVESEARLAATYDSAPVGIGEVDRDGRFLRVNGQFCAIAGYPMEELLTKTLFEITHPDDLGLDRAQFEGLWSGEIDTYSMEKRYVRKSGEPVWIELVASIVRGQGGASSYGVRIVRDITDRKKAEDHQRLLINELNHRVKNTLAIVQGLAQQTFRGKAVPDELMRAFEGRLAALSAAHNLLTEQKWEAGPIRLVIDEALKPFTEDRTVTIEGPDLLLPPQTAVSLTLAMHELGTNAAKYGSLSVQEGRVEVSWSVKGEQLHLRWQESGGPPVEQPTKRGFGIRMLEQALASELTGQVEVQFLAEGLLCTMDAPLPRAQAR
ncbi:MAG TPA: PAS domain S-box protein [Allosphingosinicella sp.]|nr:PAS domain S-box protein [Allosphingosinicella sp.]